MWAFILHTPTTMPQKPLFWSKRGEVACATHAPAQQSSRWSAEGWQVVADLEGRRITYQCQHCDKRAILHARRKPTSERPALILNVDDRPANLYARDRLLRLHGFNVANAETGRSALDTARQLLPNLILLDVHLPDVDGRELCGVMKADADLAHIPVVLISSTLRGQSPQDQPFPGGADGFILEPVEGDRLASTLRSVLGVGPAE
jgi:CheY-like chemotaxis protein